MLIFQILKLILGYKLDILGANKRAEKSKSMEKFNTLSCLIEDTYLLFGRKIFGNYSLSYLGDNSTNLFETSRASLNWLLKLADQIQFGLIERQISYDLEKFGMSITTCLLLRRKE